MAGVSDKGLISSGPWPLGVNNLAKEGALPTNEDGLVLALREADNVDLDRAGYASRRGGYTAGFVGQLTHSLWSDDLLQFGLMVDDGVLHAVHAGGSVQSLGTIVGNQPLSYALVNDRVFFSNQYACGLVTLDLQVNAWAPAQPAGQPAVSAVSGMSLPAGTYQVAITYTDLLGRESGSSLAVQVQVSANGGIALQGIPQPADITANPTINVYASNANDQVLRLYATMPSGLNSLTIEQDAQGRALATQFLSSMPAGQIVRLHSGRQFVAQGRYLRWSPALRYGLTNPSKNVIRFRDPIDMVEPIGRGGAGAGVFVATGGKTYWLGGADPDTFSQRIAHSAGVVPGTSITLPGNVLGMETTDEVLVWLSRNGQFCVGGEGGRVTALKQGQAVVNDADRGAVMYREVDGKLQLVVGLKGARQQGLAVSDRPVAHVIHDGS